MGEYLGTERSAFEIFGPRMMPSPASPCRPMATGLVQTGVLNGHPGMANAAGLNHCEMADPFVGYKLTPGTRFGRPPSTLVLDGSKPANDGVKNCLHSHIRFHEICHLPSPPFTKRLLLFRYRRPAPNGN